MAVEVLMTWDLALCRDYYLFMAHFGISCILGVFVGA